MTILKRVKKIKRVAKGLTTNHLPLAYPIIRKPKDIKMLSKKTKKTNPSQAVRGGN